MRARECVQLHMRHEALGASRYLLTSDEKFCHFALCFSSIVPSLMSMLHRITMHRARMFNQWKHVLLHTHTRYKRILECCNMIMLRFCPYLSSFSFFSVHVLIAYILSTFSLNHPWEPNSNRSSSKELPAYWRHRNRADLGRHKQSNKHREQIAKIKIILLAYLSFS